VALNLQRMGGLTTHERGEIELANATHKQPLVFIHGLWLLPSSWEHWRAHFEAQGYATVAPGWPDDPETVEEARAHPEVFADKSLKVITEHYLEAINELHRKPALIGHSFGGAIAQMIAGHGRALASVAIDPAPFRGVLPLPYSSLKTASAVIANPANYTRAIALTYEQFRYGWANAVPEAEARALFEKYHVAGAAKPLFQAATANVNPWTDDQVNTTNPARGPLLLISGEQDHTTPWAVVSAAYDRQKGNVGVTELIAFPHRGHSLTIDHGWRAVADAALTFLARHAPTS
jgi:non-heme chloroperoxidase